MDTYALLAPMQPSKSASNSPDSVKDTSFTSAPVGEKVAILENDQHWSFAGRDIPTLVLNAFLKVPEAGINKDNLTKVLM